MDILAAIFGWFLLAIAAAMIAGSKGRSSFLYFLLGLMLPVIGVILAVGVSDRRAIGRAAVTDGRPRRNCPQCAERVLAQARKCPHCGEALTPVEFAWLRSLFWGSLPPK